MDGSLELVRMDSHPEVERANDKGPVIGVTVTDILNIIN